MSEVNVNTLFCKKAGLVFVKMLEINIPGFIIHARLMSVDEESTNSSYDVYVARDHGEEKSPSIIRDWTMRGAYQPRAGGEKMFRHRNNYGATIYTIGGLREPQAKNNLISAIFDALMGSCDVRDEKIIKEYVAAAWAMYTHGVVALPITDQYRASVVTPNNNLTGSRIWHVNAEAFVYSHTTWTLNIDHATRMTYLDNDLDTTYEKVYQIFIEKIHGVLQADKVM